MIFAIKNVIKNTDMIEKVSEQMSAREQRNRFLFIIILTNLSANQVCWLYTLIQWSSVKIRFNITRYQMQQCNIEHKPDFVLNTPPYITFRGMPWVSIFSIFRRKKNTEFELL